MFSQQANLNSRYRNIRRDANSQLKDFVKDKAIFEDDEWEAGEVIQKLTDKFNAEVDVLY